MKNKSKSVLDDIPNNTSELSKAVSLCQQAATIGFDWNSIEPVFDKLNEEVAELKHAINGQNKEEILDELGDILFVMANLARHLDICPQQAIKCANIKFSRRFRAVEKLAFKKHPNQDSFDLELLDKLWNEVKILEKPNITSYSER